MEEENTPQSPRIWLYLLPLFILAAWPAAKWVKKANSDDLKLSKEEYNVFNSQEGEIRRPTPATLAAQGEPEFNDEILQVRYQTKAKATEAEKTETERLAREAAEQTSGEEAEQAKIREQYSAGATKGYLTFAVEKTMGDTKTIAAIFNNKFVISGFIGRDKVRTVTSSTQRLADHLKTGDLRDFLNNPTVLKALNDPAIVDTIASSGLIKALMETPAIAKFLRDPAAVNEILRTTPQLKTFTSSPNVVNALKKHPSTAAVADKLDIGSK